jgi:pilus assembly protein CpaB
MLVSGNHRPEAPPTVAPLATVEVLVAKSDLDTGKAIDEADIGWQTWPAASAGSSFVRQTDRPEAIKDFVGAIVRSPISAGEPIRDTKVVLGKGGGYLAAILPHGKRAISLDIAPDTDAGGFILPNDHVDVVLTQKLNGNQGFKSQIILPNVRVLAVDQVLGEKDGQKVIVGKTATIEADPPQATMIANARQLGTLSLALRSLVDSQTAASDAEAAGNDDAFAVVRYGISGSR